MTLIHTSQHMYSVLRSIVYIQYRWLWEDILIHLQLYLFPTRQWMDLTSFMYGNHHSLTIEAKEFVQNETERGQDENREITREAALSFTSKMRDDDNKSERELTIVAEIMS